MKLYFDQYPLDSEQFDGEIFVPLKSIFSLLFDFQNIRNVTKELKGVSGRNYRITGKGRGRKTFINGNGLCQILSRTIRLSYKEKLEAVRKLRLCGLTITEPVSATRKEMDFADDLSDFLSYQGIAMKRQVSIGNGSIYDIVIGDLVVEYDEDSHKQYEKETEKLREENAMANGYRLVRVSDAESNATGLARVQEALK